MTGACVTWASATKWAVRRPGDAVAVVEAGGSVICGLIVDVQGSGDGAGSLAWSLVSLGSQLAGEGCGAESIATMLNRALWTRRRGRVQAGIGVIVVEPALGATLARFGSILVDRLGDPEQLPGDIVVPAAGIDRDGLPWTARVDLHRHPVVMCSDGIAETLDQLRALHDRDSAPPPTAAELLGRAVARDKGRPKNDMSVIVVQALTAHPEPVLTSEGKLTVIDRSSPSAPEDRRV